VRRGEGGEKRRKESARDRACEREYVRAKEQESRRGESERGESERAREREGRACREGEQASKASMYIYTGHMPENMAAI